VCSTSETALSQVQEQVAAKKDELARKKAEWEKAQRDLEPLKVRLMGSHAKTTVDDSSGVETKVVTNCSYTSTP
jgi:hypothetical protein